jgi:hypothetical protein
MAYENDVFDHSLPAAADLRTKQHYFVNVDSNGKWALSGDGEGGYSMQDKPNADEYGEARVLGIAKITAGAAIAAGAYVTSDANAKAKTAGGGEIVNGQALQAASADLEVISILVSSVGAKG